TKSHAATARALPACARADRPAGARAARRTDAATPDRRVRRPAAPPRPRPRTARDARGRAGRVAHPLGPAGDRQDDPRAPARGRERRARGLLLGRPPGRKGAPAGRRGGGERAPAERPADRALRGRDPPLQQGAAGRLPPPRRGGHGDAHRGDHREPVVRVDPAPPLAHARPRARAAHRGRGGRGGRPCARRHRARARERPAHPRPRGTRALDLPLLEEAAQQRALRYDKAGEEHYNVISAFIKSLRGGDPDAAVYWMMRMLEAGEDPLFVARRMVIFAAEDVGNAEPQALQVAVAAKDAVHFVGLPEGRIPLAQAAIFLATCPKSNAAYRAMLAAAEDVRQAGPLPV